MALVTIHVVIRVSIDEGAGVASVGVDIDHKVNLVALQTNHIIWWTG